MKKRKILHRLLVFVLTIAMLAGICPQGIHIADVPLTLPEVKAADTIGNPKIEEDTTMTAGSKSYLGSYLFWKLPAKVRLHRKMEVFIIN